MAKKPLSHQIYPSDFKGQTELLARLIIFYATLPLVNFLSVFFESEGINLTDDAAIAVTAKGYNDIKNDEANNAHNEIQLRNNNLDIPFNHMKGGFQFLKTGNPTNYSQLTFWGGVISVNGKLSYPSKPSDKITMYGKYSDKDATYPGDTSPIRPYNTQNNIIMLQDNNMMADANTHNNNAENSFNTSEENTQLRNTEWSPVVVNLVKIYNYSKAFYKNNSRALGIEGFVVVETAPTHKNQKSTALQGDHVGVHGAIIGSILTNLENFDVWIIPGTDITKPPVILKANTSMAVVKGMSQFIFKNPNTLAIAKIMTTVRRTMKNK